MRSIGIAAAFFAVVSIGATAGAEQLTITSAHPDPAAGILIIDGTGFRQGVAVALEGHDLKVLSVNPRQIRTSLPTLTPGTYRLAIRGWYEYGRFVIAIYGDATPPAQAGTPALTVVASNGHVVGTVVGGTPATVARQDHGLWVTLPLDTDGVMSRYYPIFYTGAGCTGDAYAYFESNPAPLFRSVQRMSATDTTGFYPGNPPQTLSFTAMQIEDPSNPGTRMCVDAEANWWGGPLYVGPLQTIDLSQFPAPFRVQ